jgi:uncharacterized protein (DUF58 family)
LCCRQDNFTVEIDVDPLLDDVLTPGFLRKLDPFRLAVRRSLGTRPGNTPMPSGSQATGLEIARHKSYAPGDELRYVDWNAYGRLDQLLVKQFRAEREAPLHLFVDTSASMGRPAADRKLSFALALATGLSYVSLRQYDPVRVISIGGTDAVFRASRWFRHLGRLPQLQGFLAGRVAEGAGTLATGIRAYLETTRVPGLAVVLSDFLVSPDDYENALDQLHARGCSVAAVRLLGPRERDPDTLRGSVRLRDAETGRQRLVRLTRQHRDAYVRALQDHLDQLRDWCTRRAMVCTIANTATGVERCLLHDFTHAGLLR